MFETLPNPSLEVILIAGRAIMLFGAFCVFALAFIRWRRADARDMQAMHSQLERAFIELRSLHETISVMGARLEALNERSEVDSRLAPGMGAQRGYDLATRLARKGSDIEELIASCGITRHEAELLVRLHGARGSAAQGDRQTVWPTGGNGGNESRPVPKNTGRKRGSLVSVVG
jgi:hypothetical protein